MKFETVGNPDGSKVLLIHAMFMTPECFSVLIQYLKEDYFIIMPILDGHDFKEGSEFLSVYDEADKIIAYLQENNIKKLDFIMGISLGAIIALEVYRRNAVNVNRIYSDGGPFFNFGTLLQEIAAKKFWNICIEVRQNPEKAARTIDKLFQGLGNVMSEVCKSITEQNVKNLARACYSYKLPELNEAEQKSVAFLYGTKEPARFCIPRLKKYKNCRIIKKSGYSHCSYLLAHPGEYAEMLRRL